MIEKHDTGSPQRKLGASASTRGQVAIEFLAMMAMGIVMISIALLMYSSFRDAAEKNRSALEAQSICSRLANIIAGTIALGEGAYTNITGPKEMITGNYTIQVLGNRSLVRVTYFADGNKFVSCGFPKINVTKAGGNTFIIPEYGGIINYIDGGLFFEN